MMIRRVLQKIRWRSFFVATFASLVVLSAIVALLSQYVREHDLSHERNADALAQGELMAVRAEIESALYRRLSLPIALSAFVISNPDFEQDDFVSFANSLKDSVPGVMSLQLAPDAVVTYVTDVERNRQALGHDLLGDLSRRSAVVRSIEERKFIVAGPLNLLQGGRAIIARLPIFLKGHQGETGFRDFWGFATILIDVEALFSDAGVAEIDPRVALAIRGVDGLGADGDPIIGDAGVFDQVARVVEVELPNGSWQLAAMPRHEAFEHNHPAFSVTATLGTSLLGALVWSLVYRQGSRELRSAKKQAEIANKMKSDFIAVMSHEMRTPLNGILGVLDLLRSTDLSKKQSDYVNTATTAGEHLLHQVNDVLDISRAGTGHLTIEDRPLNIAAILDNSLKVNSSLLAAKQLELRRTVTLPMHKVRGAPHRVQQVLVNLIGNAVKFTDNGRITVEVSTVREGGGVSEVEFSVTDTGIGIAEAEQAYVFDDFVTLDAGYSRNANGSGLGLAISRRLVGAMGGEIGVVSTPGAGSKFWFRIPFRWSDESTEKAVDAAIDQPEGELTTSETKGSLGSLEVLLIEDNEVNRMVARDLLCLAGHLVEEARDGQEGVDIALAKGFDLILMDVSMPKKDGVQATREIRGSEGPNKDTPIVGLTAHVMVNERERFLNAGMNACLAKPIRLRELKEVLDQEPAPLRSHSLGDGEQPGTTLDPVVLDDLRQTLPPDLLRKTLEKACTEIETEITVLKRLLRHRDFGALGMRAHKLAGTAAIVGATELRDLLHVLENATKRGDFEPLEEPMASLPRAASRTIEHLRLQTAGLSAA